MKLLKIASSIVFFAIASICNAQVATPTIWDSIPDKGKYEFFKTSSFDDNKKVFDFYESKQDGRVLAACIPNAYGFYVRSAAAINVTNLFDAESHARKICGADASVLLAYSSGAEVNHSGLIETTYKDKFNGESIKIHKLRFTKALPNGDDASCNGCLVWIWPSSVVVEGGNLITGGAASEMTNIPSRLRLGKKIFRGFCRIQDSGGSCVLNMNELSNLKLAALIRGHTGEVALEFTQIWTSIKFNHKYTDVTTWNATIGAIEQGSNSRNVKF